MPDDPFYVVQSIIVFFMANNLKDIGIRFSVLKCLLQHLPPFSLASIGVETALDDNVFDTDVYLCINDGNISLPCYGKDSTEKLNDLLLPTKHMSEKLNDLLNAVAPQCATAKKE